MRENTRVIVSLIHPAPIVLDTEGPAVECSMLMGAGTIATSQVGVIVALEQIFTAGNWVTVEGQPRVRIPDTNIVSLQLVTV